MVACSSCDMVEYDKITCCIDRFDVEVMLTEKE